MRERIAGVEPELNDLTQRAIGVHRHLGPGFQEATYEKALAVELRLRNIPYQLQRPVKLSYKGESLGEGRVDVLVEERLIVELKAVERLSALHQAQVISYLRATGHQLGLLINFNVQRLYEGVQRIINT